MPPDGRADHGARRVRARHHARGELAWIEARERDAREGVRRSLVALGNDVSGLLGMRQPAGSDPLARRALEGAGTWLASEQTLAAVEAALAGSLVAAVWRKARAGPEHEGHTR